MTPTKEAMDAQLQRLQLMGKKLAVLKEYDAQTGPRSQRKTIEEIAREHGFEWEQVTVVEVKAVDDSAGRETVAEWAQRVEVDPLDAHISAIWDIMRDRGIQTVRIRRAGRFDDRLDVIYK
jgi:hypothetical protein